MIVTLKVRRSTMAVQRRGSVNVFVHPPKDSLEAMATLFFFALGQHLKEQFGAMPVEFHVAEFVDAEEIDAAVAGDGLVQLLLVGGLDQLVDQLRASV
jgi:hypothetical protein